MIEQRDRQQDHPPERELHRPGRPEVRADRSARLNALSGAGPSRTAESGAGRPAHRLPLPTPHESTATARPSPAPALDYYRRARRRRCAARPAPGTRLRLHPARAWPRTSCAAASPRSSMNACCRSPSAGARSRLPVVPGARGAATTSWARPRWWIWPACAMRIAAEGGDPAQVNPVVPVQLIVDHSLAVECGGFDPDAFAKNRAIEDRRNEDRFHFIDWTKRAFAQRGGDPARATGSCIRSTSRRCRRWSTCRTAWPSRHLRGHRQPHAARRRAGRDRASASGGLEAENVMLGRASWMRLPDIVGVELHAAAASRASPPTDIVLALTEFLRKEKVVGAYLEFYGEGARSADARRSRDHLQHGPEVRRHRRAVPHRRADPRLPAPHRPRGRAGAAGRDLREDRRPLGRHAGSPPHYERVLQLRSLHRGAQHGRARPTRTAACRPPNWPSADRHRPARREQEAAA